MEGLLSVYIASAIFGAGVITVDMLGLLGISKDGEDGDDDGSDDHDDGGDDGEDAHDAHGDDEGDEHGHDHDDLDLEDVSDQAVVEGSKGGAKGAVMMHDRGKSKKLVLRSIATLKTLVYFAFGFGATGWFALSAADKTNGESLLWSAGVGVFMAVVARAVKRLQRNEFDSSFKTTDLLMEEAEVTIPIDPGGTGRIRIHYNGIYIDRFAKGNSPHTSFKKGELVRIVNITDEYFFIE